MHFFLAQHIDDVIWVLGAGCWVLGAGCWVLGSNSVSHDGQALVSGDDFGTIKLFKFPCILPSSGTKKIGHAAHVTNVKFTAEDKYVVSAGGDDSCLFVWRTER